MGNTITVLLQGLETFSFRLLLLTYKHYINPKDKINSNGKEQDWWGL